VAETGELLMTQADRDRLVALKKTLSKAITQRQAAEELKISERQVRRLLVKLRTGGDRAILHGLRGRRSNRKMNEEVQQRAATILKQDVYRGFGPTLASEYLAKRHGIEVSKETARKWMTAAGLWRARPRRVVEVHTWRARRERFGELVQWDTSEHDWTEGRGEKMYLVSMIDDATSRVFARFVPHDAMEENMAVLEQYVQRYGRPLELYTDKASIFYTTPKKNHPVREEPHPPTQIGRALAELNIGWIAAHSPQAKGRIERSFDTAQDRLVKGMRVAGVKTIEQANAYLENEYLPEWNAKFAVVPACADDAHRPLRKQDRLDTILCRVEERVVGNDYTVRLHGQTYQIVRADIQPRLRAARLRIEQRRDGTVAVRFENQYLQVEACEPVEKVQPQSAPRPKRTKPRAGGNKNWMKGFLDRSKPTLGQAIVIANATS
jgi:transposase